MLKKKIKAEAYNNVWLDVIPLTKDTLQKSLDRLQLNIPEELEALFLSCNGGYPKNNTYFGKYEVSIGNLLSVGNSENSKTISFEEMYTAFSNQNETAGNFIPFAWDTGNANLFCISIADCSVIYYLHDEPDCPIKVVASSLNEFINNLEEL